MKQNLYNPRVYDNKLKLKYTLCTDTQKQWQLS